jgi:parallel beta-helix repeat protein
MEGAMLHRNKALYLLCLLQSFWVLPAHASDGVIEINQACAVNGGCFPGDTAGFPVTALLNPSRSYILTSDLRVEDVDAFGIDLGRGATLDLNGFTIQGPVFCVGSGTEIECSNSGGGVGVIGSSNSTIKNGTVTGFGAAGITIVSGRITEVAATRNGGIGIQVNILNTNTPQGSLVSDCIASGNSEGILVKRGIVKNSNAFGNGTYGIKIIDGGSVYGSTSMNNGGNGIDVGLGTPESETTLEKVSNNTSTNNGGVGIIGGNGVHIENNLVSENDGNGIQVHVGGLIRGNTVFNNGGHGIHAGSSNLIADNAMRGNAGFGLFFFGGSQSNYHGNLMSVNTGGSVGGAGTGINMGLNTCGPSACP